MILPRLFTISIIALLFHLPAVAQDGESSLLPEINPQDIEIRSEFQARFPGLRRQPILGFNPKPRVYQVDPDRMPFMEEREDAVAGIEVTELDRPEPPSRRILPIPDRVNAFVRAGFGSYLSPEINAYGFSHLGDRSLVSADANFRASDGHLENQESSFRYLDVNAKMVHKLQEDLRVTLDAGIVNDFNNLFHLQENFQNSIGETADKDYLGAGFNLSMEKIQNTLEGWKIDAGANVFTIDVNAGSTALTGEIDEQAFHAAVSKYWAGSRMYETFDITGSVEGGNYTSTDFESEQWLDAKAAVEYKRLFNFSTHVSSSVGVQYVSDAFSENVYIVPEVLLKHNLRDAVIITGNAYARPEVQSVQEHHQFNRFLNHKTHIRHSYNIGAGGEIAFQPIEGNNIYGGISYDYIRDYAFYQRAEMLNQSESILEFYDVQYANASIFELYAGISHQLVPEKFWVNARLYGRNPSLTDNGDIPYEERLGFEGSLSYKPFNKLTLQSWAEYIGKREDPASADDLNAFILLNGGAEYQIHERFGLYVKVLNILGQDYEIWNGYQERPFQIFGGITFKI